MNRYTQGIVAGAAFGSVMWFSTESAFDHMQYNEAEKIDLIEACAAHLVDHEIVVSELPEDCKRFKFTETTTIVTDDNTSTRYTEFTLPDEDNFRTTKLNTLITDEQRQEDNRRIRNIMTPAFGAFTFIVFVAAGQPARPK